MKVTGIIAEYNPFHNGHYYHIEQTRKLTSSDYIIAVMSGNFVQRGAPALTDKYLRAQMALESGIDLVLELPVFYSTSSAEFFARGAISLLNKLGTLQYLSFGSETGDISLLLNAAKLLETEDTRFKTTLQAYLSTGHSYPAAYSKAVSLSPNASEGSEAAKTLASPNNLLGIEYLKALSGENSPITPITVKRAGAAYHTSDLNASHSYPSATALRKLLESSQEPELLKGWVPETVLELLNASGYLRSGIGPDDFSALVHYRLLTESPQELISYLDIHPDLADRIHKYRYEFRTITEFCRKIHSRNLTYGRISRSLMHILLSIGREELSLYRNAGWIPYARVLGFRKSAEPLLRAIKNNASIPLITRPAKAASLLSDTGRHMFDQDITASHIYESIASIKCRRTFYNEYSRKLLVL